MTDVTARKPEMPYPGLRPFEPHESSIFFGRAEQIADMLTKLETKRFLAVVGSSGSGKSSLVRAGLLPALRDGFLMNTSEDWLFLIARPGLSPYASLADSFCRSAGAGESDPTPLELSFAESQLRSGRLGIVELLRKRNVPEERHVLVLVDQFEELFRFRNQSQETSTQDDVYQDRNAAIAFVDLLLSTAKQTERTIYVVITMRSDFLGDCNAFFGLPEAISDSQFLASRLTRDQLVEVISDPLPQFGGTIQPDVANHIVNEVGANPDQLPLMQHALMRMWGFAKPAPDAEPKRHLEESQYALSGGVELALNLHANEVYQSLGDSTNPRKQSPQQHIAEWLFRSLARRTPNGQLVRRLTTVGEVAQIAGASAELVVAVVQTFAAQGVNFLVTSPPGPITGSTSIDISHESLLRQWNQVRDWVTLESQASAELLKLVEDAKLWKEKRRGLLQQPELGLFQKWRQASVPSRDWAARYVKPEEFDLADEYLRQSLRRNKNLRRISIAVASVIVALSIFSIYEGYKASVSAQKAAESEQAALKSEWKAQHQLAMNHLDAAGSEMERGQIPAGLFRYWQAYHEAPQDDPLKRNARSLPRKWTGTGSWPNSRNWRRV